MAKENQDILLDDNNDDLVKDGDFVIGDGIDDDISIILALTTGALKSDPLLGPNLVSMINSKKSVDEIAQAIKLHLKRDNKFPTAVKLVNGAIKVDFE